MTDVLQELAARLRADGGLLADVTADPAPAAATDLGRVAAGGAAGDPRRAAEYALLVEAIHEGYLAHYAAGRVLQAQDPDLALLAGDHLYALGMEHLARLGDVDSVAILAGVIARCAQAHAERRPEDAAGIWRAGAAAVAVAAAGGSGGGPNT